MIEPMYFINDTTVGFGAPLFEVMENEKKKTVNRFCLEYKKDAVTTLNYKPEYKAIVFDHTSERSSRSTWLVRHFVAKRSQKG